MKTIQTAAAALSLAALLSAGAVFAQISNTTPTTSGAPAASTPAASDQTGASNRSTSTTTTRKKKGHHHKKNKKGSSAIGAPSSANGAGSQGISTSSEATPSTGADGTPTPQH